MVEFKLGDYFKEIADIDADRVNSDSPSEPVRANYLQALHWYQLAEKVAGQLQTAEFPAAGSDLGATLDRLIDVYLQLQRFEDAKACAEEVIKVRRQLVDDAGADDARRNLGVAMEKMGNLLLQMKDPTTALKWYMSSLQVSQELLASDPRNTEFERDVAMSYLKIASAHANLHHSTETFTALEHYRELIEKQALAAPFDAELQEDFANAHRYLAGEYLKMSRPEDARKQFQMALDVLVGFNERAQRVVFHQQIKDLRTCLEECDKLSAAPKN